jgi:protein-serine/threonine kinase
MNTKYQPICTLGKGGQGFVMKAKSMYGHVAIKVTQKQAIQDWIDDGIDIIPYEVYCMKRAQHKNIIKLLDSFQDEHFYYYVMPLYEKYTASQDIVIGFSSPSIDLFELIESNEITEPMAKRLFMQAIDAIDHLHKCGITHGDIKDENFLVDANLTLYLIDFGSARPSGFVTPKVFKGTLQYAAPEVFGQLPFHTVQADIWSLGIMLYVLLFKRLPFCSLSEVMCVEPPFVKGFENGYDLVELLLAKDPDQRPFLTNVKNHPWFR